MPKAFRVTIATITLLTLLSTLAFPNTLEVKPVYQETPEWCWLAVAEMLFTYFGIPPIRRDGVPFQCQLAAIEGAHFSICRQNCAACPVPAGSVEMLAKLIKRYPHFIAAQDNDERVNDGRVKGLNADVVNRPLTKEEIRQQLSNVQPIVALIDPSGRISLRTHAVLIVGWSIKSDEFWLEVNDPFPYQTSVGTNSPYQNAGGSDDAPRSLVHQIPYNSFKDGLNWNASIYNIHPI
jgi:hypothetical protein